MTKTLKSRAIDPATALAAVNQVAPFQPPAVMPTHPGGGTGEGATSQPAASAAPRVRTAMLAQRFAETTLDNLADAARLAGVTQKVFIARAFREAGVDVHPSDLEDRTPAKRRGKIT